MTLVKIVLDAGHGFNTAGKRTPDGEREWSFNDAVVRAAIARLANYHDVEILRVDDPTGKTDITLAARTSRANSWKADVYVSVHHNANTANWGSWGGVETYTHPTASRASCDIAAAIHPRIVGAMGIADRGLKTANFQVLRDTNMPAILTEGGFMDSTRDIVAMRNPAKLKAQGEAIAEGLAAYFGLKAKVAVVVAQAPKPVEVPTSPTFIRAGKSHQVGQDFVMANGISDGSNPEEPVTREQVWTMLERFNRMK